MLMTNDGGISLVSSSWLSKSLILGARYLITGLLNSIMVD